MNFGLCQVGFCTKNHRDFFLAKPWFFRSPFLGPCFKSVTWMNLPDTVGGLLGLFS